MGNRSDSNWVDEAKVKYIGTEHISVHSRTEQTNIFVEKIFLYGRILVFYWKKEYQNKSQNSEFMEYVQGFLD